MKKIIANFPNQLEEKLEFSKKDKLPSKCENIIICGMGGSAFPANVVVSWLNNSKKDKKSFPFIYVHRDYDLPKITSEQSLIICISYSGNTEETISALEKAVKNNLQIVGISSGGRLKEICQEYNIPFIKIPPGLPSRLSTGYLFRAILDIFVEMKLTADISSELTKIAKLLNEAGFEKKGKNLAKKIFGKIPIIYAPNSYKFLARIWKIEFNENAKIPCFWNYFPELNHNEMTGFSENFKLNKNFHIIILRDAEGNPKVQQRMELFAKMAKPLGIDTTIIDILKGEVLLKIFSTLLLGNWASYYLALDYKIDPTPVQMVEEFKKKMAR